MTGAVTTNDGNLRVLSRISGVLAAVAGVGSAWVGVNWFLLERLGFDFSIALIFVSGVLGITGAVFAFQGRLTIAPWLMLASLIVNLLVNLLSQFWVWPWGPFIYFSDTVEFFGLANTLMYSLADLAVYLMLIAFVLALIGFIRSPRQPSRSTGDTDQSPGIAVPNADGSIPEGWYADPDGKPAERYWDGSEWTEKSRPRTAATATAMVAGAAKPTVTATGELISPKSRAAAAILCWFLGVIGIHRFYVGKVGTGVAQIFTLGGLGIWALIDFIMILVGSFRDSEEKVLINW